MTFRTAPSPTASTDAADLLVARLRAALGSDRVIDDAAERDYYGCDIAGPGAARPAAVARPKTIEDVVSIVRAACAEGRAIVPRGGGLSYTGGYQTDRRDAILVDMRDCSAIETVAEADGYVIAQAGCAWGALYDALAARGLRTPFFGPLSGVAATVGGALSQHAAFFGSAEHGASVESVLGLEVVLSSGEILRTGAWAARDGAPFQRAFGPDLTGLFLGDCGAFGVKTRVALKLIPMPRSAFASFAAPDMRALVEAQRALAGVSGLAECFGFDPAANDNLRRSGFTMQEKAQSLRDVARAGGGAKGVAAAALLALRRTKFLDDVAFSLHLASDGESDAEAEAVIARARAALARFNLREIADSVPRATRARPFRPIKALLGPDGERWLPAHGLVPLSRAMRAVDAVEAVLSASRGEMEARGVRASILTTLVGRAFLIEPQFFWKDSLTPFHLRRVTASQRERFSSREADPAARDLARRLRADVVAALDRVGATHFQIGRYYALADALSGPAHRALCAVKAALDPASAMNPGVLGLSSPRSDNS